MNGKKWSENKKCGSTVEELVQSTSTSALPLLWLLRRTFILRKGYTCNFGYFHPEILLFLKKRKVLFQPKLWILYVIPELIIYLTGRFSGFNVIRNLVDCLCIGLYKFAIICTNKSWTMISTAGLSRFELKKLLCVELHKIKQIIKLYSTIRQHNNIWNCPKIITNT